MAGLLDDFRQSISSWKAEYEKHQALFGAVDPRAHEIIPFLCASIEQQLPSDSEKTKIFEKAKTLWAERASRILGEIDNGNMPFGVASTSQNHYDRMMTAVLHITLDDEAWKRFEVADSLQKMEAIRKASFISTLVAMQVPQGMGALNATQKTITLSRTVRDITLSGEYPTARTPLLSGFSKASKGNLPQNSSPPQQKKEQNQTTSSQNVSTPVPTTPKKTPATPARKSANGLFSAQKGGIAAGVIGGLLFAGMMFL